MTAPAFDVGFTLNIRHLFDSSARQFRARTGLMHRSTLSNLFDQFVGAAGQG